MSTKTLPLRDKCVQHGRPKGVPTVQIQRMLATWDSMKEANPQLNHTALIRLVAESIFGSRLNASVSKRDRDRLTRALRRYGRLGTRE
jgi:hypothetical protein